MRKKVDIAEKLERLSKEEGVTSLAFNPKRAVEIEEKPLVGPTGLPIPSSIKDLTIPESAFELFTLEVTTDPSEKERASQLLGLREDPRAKVMWTVVKDADSKEFETLKSEKLVRIRSYPSMYGREVHGGALLVSHQGGYTFSMASRDIKIKELVRLFEYGLECTWKYELKV
jgi:hypothetical protein